MKLLFDQNLSYKLVRQLDNLGFTEDEATDIASRLVPGAGSILKKWTEKEEQWRKSGNNE